MSTTRKPASSRTTTGKSARKPKTARTNAAKSRKKTAPKKKKSGKTAAPKASLKPALTFLALAGLLVAGLYLFFSLGQAPGKRPATPTRTARSARPTPKKPQKAPAGEPTIKIFLPAGDAGSLQPTVIRFNQNLSGSRRARAIIRELTRSRPGIVSPLPTGTKLLEISFEASQITLNLSRELSDGLKTSGAQDEIIALACLSNSILANFPGYARLQLLIDGRKQKTLAGHIDISRPLGRQKLSL